MAELADAPDLGSGVYDVQVQVLLSALHQSVRILILQWVLALFICEKIENGAEKGQTIKCLFWLSSRYPFLLISQ